MPMVRTTTEVFEDHLHKRLKGEVKEDISTNFSPDVVVLTGTGAFYGHEGVQESAKQLAANLGAATFEYRHTLIEGEYAFLEWTAHAEGKKVCDGADSFVIRDGKIIFQSIHYSTSE
ncbi:MAG TPA: nuclear transport factor 2 family protein [Candidatus Saccharimonadales bacterium]